jgi:molecular chaperone DnaK
MTGSSARQGWLGNPRTRTKETAEAYLGGNVTQAVITVPAHFQRRQHQRTRMPAGLLVAGEAGSLGSPLKKSLASGIVM